MFIFQDLDVCFDGIPLDVGANYRTGTRFGPRAIRTESVMIRRDNNNTGDNSHCVEAY